jgi:hypothetical protein
MYTHVYSTAIHRTRGPERRYVGLDDMWSKRCRQVDVLHVRRTIAHDRALEFQDPDPIRRQPLMPGGVWVALLAQIYGGVLEKSQLTSTELYPWIRSRAGQWRRYPARHRIYFLDAWDLVVMTIMPSFALSP